MDLVILNTDLEAVSIIDTYKSFIWTDRYQSYGDFELYTPFDVKLLDSIKTDYYIKGWHSEHVMIVEDLTIKTDAEEGAFLTVKGRSLESILDRRIIWGQITISGNLQAVIKSLLEDCIINPSESARKIDNFIFEESTDPLVTDIEIETQYTGDNLYDIVKTICEELDLGFKITLNENNQFVFKLYAGVDRSYDQIEVPYVIFSPNFENLINSNFIESKSYLKNVTLIGGEGEGSARRYAAIGEDVSGLNRRELFTDARDISSDVGDGVTLTEEEYIAQLEQRGIEKLAENSEFTSFEGQIDNTTMFKYGEDFFNGDIIQLENEYGHQCKARIFEIVMSEDESGSSVYPTFKSLSQEGEYT